MAKKIEKKAEAQAEVKEQHKATAAEWIEKNANAIMWVVLGVLVIILGVLALKKYVFEPKQVAAADASWAAQQAFEAGAYELALNGDDNELIGFAAIADQYSNQEGELAALYAGLCEYELGDFEAAADYLKDFSADDINIAPAAQLKLGDVYVELTEYSKAVKAFKAAAASDNKLVAPMALKKAGIVYLEMGENASAVKMFEQIKSEYPTSNEAQDIDKYIAVAE